MMISAHARDEQMQRLTREWFDGAARYEYTYRFSWLGRPIIQFPQDIVALQEIIWAVKPDVIVETGIAHGGSLVFSASMLELIGGDHRRVLGVDIDIREHNRVEIEQHPLSKRITMIEGSSVEQPVIEEVRSFVGDAESVLVILDSNHTHEHVLRELELYSPFVTAGSYLIVFDTVIEFMPDDAFPNRPWGKGANPYTAVEDFLRGTDRFEVDDSIAEKLLFTVAPGGYLRCVR
jgi:cephalosporin hydroxylase